MVFATTICRQENDMKEVGNVHVKVPGSGADPMVGTERKSTDPISTPVETTRSDKTAKGADKPGDVLVKGHGPRAPDAGLEASVTLRTDAKTALVADVHARVPQRQTAAPWQPDLLDRSEGGVTRFTPVSTPWAPTFEGAVEAAKNVPALTQPFDFRSGGRIHLPRDGQSRSRGGSPRVPDAGQSGPPTVGGPPAKPAQPRTWTAALEGVPADQARRPARRSPPAR